MQDTWNHGPHLDRGHDGCLVPRMETIVLNGAAVSHSQARAVCPGRVPDSRGDSFESSVRWVCREISMSPVPGCLTQEGSGSGLGRSQTFLARSVGSQKPPIHDGVRRVNNTRVTAHQERAKTSEYSGRNSPPSNTNCADSEPLSPTLDATIENLNNLILELDPTFQPITTCPRRGRLTSGCKGQLAGHSEDSLLDTQSPGILIYDEWESRSSDSDSISLSRTCEPDSPGPRHQMGAVQLHGMPETTPHHVLCAGNTNCPSLLHSSSIPTASDAPPFTPLSPDYWVAGSLANSSPCAAEWSSRQWSECLDPNSSSPQQSSQPIAVPPASRGPSTVTSSLPHQHSQLPVNMARPGEHSGSYLSTSTDSDILLPPAHGQRRRLGDSASSLCSTSPGWDILGSSQSLLSDEGDAGRFYRAAGTTFGSSGSFVNMVSPSPVSEQQLQGKAASFRTLPLPRRQVAQGSAGSDPAAAPPGLKKHANSCPASAAGSCTDIPLLLVNGCSRFPAHDSRGPQRQRQGLPSVSASTPSLPRAACPSREFSASTSSLADIPRDVEPTVKFVQDTTKYWYKPRLSRDQAIEILKDKEPGSFLIRESSTYIGSFGLAMKVSSNPDSPERKTGDSSSESVRHFLIEFSPRGVCLKGCTQEPYFGSLSALVYQHCITALSLPHALRLPRTESPKGRSEGRSADAAGDNASPQRKAGAGCSVLYLHSVTMESLTGPQAVLKAASCALEQQPLAQPTRVHFKVSEQGITLTDSKRKLFFRRHYHAGSITHCGLDPLQRRWRKDNEPSRIFAFVAKKLGSSSENVCHVFAELERENSAHLIIGLVTSTLLEPVGSR